MTCQVIWTVCNLAGAYIGKWMDGLKEDSILLPGAI